MIALCAFLFLLALAIPGLVALASLLGRHLRRQRKMQYPMLHVVRDERADISAATRRDRVNN